MSYDYTIGKREGNYTSNGCQIYYNHMEDGIPGLHGLTGKQAAIKISGWIESFKKEMMLYWSHDDIGEPKICEKYDSKNGWGSTLHAVIFLMEILSACNEYPRHKLYISY